MFISSKNPSDFKSTDSSNAAAQTGRIREASLQLAYFFKGSALLPRLTAAPITLLETAPKLTAAQVEAVAISPTQPIYVCDAVLDGFQGYAEIKPYGLESGRITNIDHHSDLKEMRRYISSGNLAINYINQFGPVPQDSLVVINHKDCDSVLSSLLVRGLLPPDEKFGQAVIDADHRGCANPISDLLQSLQHWGMHLPPSDRFAFSVRNLELFLSGEPLHPEAQKALEGRRLQRQQAKNFVESGKFTQIGKVAFALSDSKIDPELFLPHLPAATIIMFAYPAASQNGNFEVRLRLGLNPPEDFSLLHLRIDRHIDRGFGGRWNAGSNRRAGGTSIDPLEYAKSLSELLE